jgi:hypothetical protein
MSVSTVRVTPSPIRRIGMSNHDTLSICAPGGWHGKKVVRFREHSYQRFVQSHSTEASLNRLD